MFRRGPCNLKPADFCIVTDDGLPIGRESHVELETIATGSEREIERSYRVFRNGLPGTRATVTEKQRNLHRV